MNSQEAVIINGYCNYGKLRARLINSQEAVTINGYCNNGKLRARLINPHHEKTCLWSMVESFQVYS